MLSNTKVHVLSLNLRLKLRINLKSKVSVFPLVSLYEDAVEDAYARIFLKQKMNVKNLS